MGKFREIKHEYLRSRAYIRLSLSSPSDLSSISHIIEILVLLSWIHASKKFHIRYVHTNWLVRPAPGLRPGYPGPIHGPGPGSEEVRVQVQKSHQKWLILGRISAKITLIFKYLPLFHLHWKTKLNSFSSYSIFNTFQNISIMIYLDKIVENLPLAKTNESFWQKYHVLDESLLLKSLLYHFY